MGKSPVGKSPIGKSPTGENSVGKSLPAAYLVIAREIPLMMIALLQKQRKKAVLCVFRRSN